MNKKENIFLSILENYKGIIYKVANSYCHNKSDQDDLVQEITIQIWQSIDKFNDDYKWATWIYRIALNTSISFYRKHKNLKDKTVNLNPVIEIPNTHDEQPDNENFILLRRFIRELKEIDRALIILHLDGLSSQEIADVIATTQTNVTTRIHRIKNKLKTKFKTYNK